MEIMKESKPLTTHSTVADSFLHGRRKLRVLLDSQSFDEIKEFWAFSPKALISHNRHKNIYILCSIYISITIGHKHSVQC